MSAKRRKKGKKGGGRSRRLALKCGLAVLAAAVVFTSVSVWFVHHPYRWVSRMRSGLPGVVFAPLMYVGNAVGDVTDGLGWTGHDAVYEYDVEAPSGSVLFAGMPRRTGDPAPNDITVLDRGEFLVGWSQKMRHPVWCAYHVVKDERYPAGKRPGFTRDKSTPGAPKPSAYERSGYDRGHMVPNYAMATRYGDDVQRRTFLTSNIAPQTPSLNRGPWRDVEHRIADLWTARYGEIWVIVGCISLPGSDETVSGGDIDVPDYFYQVVVAQEGLDVRAFAVLFPKNIPYGAYPARNLISIDELEELSGMDFLPDLPEFMQNPLESELPSRLWPVRARDIFKQIAIRFH